MLSVLFAGDARTTSPPREARQPPDLVEWLRAGRLTLLDEYQEPVTEKDWAELPASLRNRALEDFHRVARGGTKAVVLSLRP